jgi:hypothetical protein
MLSAALSFGWTILQSFFLPLKSISAFDRLVDPSPETKKQAVSYEAE